jgi:hypothetical protein
MSKFNSISFIEFPLVAWTINIVTIVNLRCLIVFYNNSMALILLKNYHHAPRGTIYISRGVIYNHKMYTANSSLITLGLMINYNHNMFIVQARATDLTFARKAS